MESEEIKQYLINFMEETLNTCEAFTKIYGKNFVRQRLEMNLEKVITNVYSQTDKEGVYDIEHSCIILFSRTDTKEPLKIADIENNKKLKYSIVHEMIHAIFRRTKEECESIGIEDGTGVLEFYNNGLELGRGLNEGLTQWICQKAGYGTVAYLAEIGIIRILELAIGEEAVMQLPKGDIKGNIAQLLQMDEEECRYTLNLVDKIYKNEEKIYSSDYTIKDNTLDKSISHFEATIFEKYFGEEIEKAQKAENISEQDIMHLNDLYMCIKGGKTWESRMFDSRLPFKFKNEIYPELIKKYQEAFITRRKEERAKKEEERKATLPTIYKKSWTQRLSDWIKEKFMKLSDQNTIQNQGKKSQEPSFRKYISEMSNYSDQIQISPKEIDVGDIKKEKQPEAHEE